MSALNIRPDGLDGSSRRQYDGVSLLATELDGKRQELLIELIPEARRISALTDPNTSTTLSLPIAVEPTRKVFLPLVPGSRAVSERQSQ